ncbi:SseB family protein [Micromonospora sp. CPCC 205561]|uniref:SseB family protein n=1 Tax=Micromonospora sp. CPCC 205561 TaxID=3122407 RepID=UPI002FF09352
MTPAEWPDIVARLHDTLSGCDHDTDLEVAAGPRRLHLMVRRDTVRGVCPPYDERCLAELGWRAPRGAGGWWYETPRTAEDLRWWSDFATRTAAAVLSTRPGALSCQVLPPTGPRVRPEPTLPTTPRTPVARPPAPPAVAGTAPVASGSGATPATGPVAASPTGPVAASPTGPVAAPPTGPVAADEAGDDAVPDAPSVLDLLGAAAARRELPRYLGALAAAAVCVPLAAEPGPGHDLAWTVVTDPTGAPLLPVFTSPDALTDFAGEGVPFAAVPCAELLAQWPDPAWGLVVDPGTPRALALDAAALAALLAANPPAL